MPRLARLVVVASLLAATLVLDGPPPSAAQTPAGEVTVSFHVTLAPSWYDPSTAPPQITPFGVLYAIHDALVRPLPGQKMAPSLAESWTESPDGLVYEFKLRRGLKFHNGDPLTTEDVKWSFERYKGAGAKELQARERDVKKREALLHRIQQLTIDRVMFAPVMDLRVLQGIGPRVAVHTITDIWQSPWPSYEDIKLKE